MSSPILHPDSSLAERVMEMADLFPESNALCIKDQYYSYRALSLLVSKIASRLFENGVPTVIGVYCKDDVYTYASILAINLYGSTYVPLNPVFPSMRNRRIVEECKIGLILTSGNDNELKVFSGIAKIMNVVELLKRNDSDQMITRDFTKVKGNASDHSHCYILFTSGSTGEPKGVPVSCGNVRHFFNYFLTEYDFNENDRFLQCYELSFDVSVFSFFMPLLVGACCYVLPEEGIKSMKIAACLKKYSITVASMVPSVLHYLERYLNEIQLPDLRFSFFSGDALSYASALKWSTSIPSASIHNFYGPTETTIVCTKYIFDSKGSFEESMNGIVPLGKAFPGMDFLIVDEHNIQTQKGELCFTGTQVISAYLNGIEEDRFFYYLGKRYYKTGDIVSVNEKGNLIFYGRADDQVKINGYRVELGEIKHEIEKLTEKRAEILFSDGALIAFLEKSKFTDLDLFNALSELLPEYMIPRKLFHVDDFPLNVNGKTDKNKLLNLQK